MNEQEFIAQEQAKLDARLLRQLKAVAAHQIISRKVNETLWFNGLIELHGPSDTCKYNHYRLTATGRAELDRLILLAHISPRSVGK
jgi:hypothetical protein